MNILFFTYNTCLIKNWILNLKNNLSYEDDKIFVLTIDNNIYHSKVDISGLNIINISQLTVKEISELVDKIEPNIYVIFSYRSIIELLIVRIIKNKKIRIVYIQHGILAKEYLSIFSKKLVIKLQLSAKDTIFRQYNFFKKYFEFLIINRNKIKELKILLLTFLFKKYYLMEIDKFLLFSKNSYDTHSNIFKLNRNNSEIIGYPVFDAININKTSFTDTNYVLYIHDNYIQSGLTYLSYEEELNFIEEIILSFKKLNYKVIMQLHPEENINFYRTIYKKLQIEIISSSNLEEIVKNSKIVIGHTSTALYTPLILLKPIIFIQYPKLKINYSFFDDVGIHIKELSEIDLIFNSSQPLINTDNYKNYITNNLGLKNSFKDFVVSIKKEAIKV